MKSGKGFWGSLRPQDIEDLVQTIKQAKADDKGLVFFVWKNDRDRRGSGPALSLSAAVSQDRQEDRQDRVRRRPIGAPQRPTPADDDDDPFPEGDDPFGDEG
jgi:hypothetical protein